MPGARSSFVKWFGAFVSGILTLAAVVFLGATLLGYWKLNRDHDNPVPQLDVALTPVHLKAWSDGEIIRSIREGIHRNGRSLLIMPANLMRHLSDSDVQAIVAYLRSLPPEGPKTPRNRLNVLGAAMINMAPIFQAQPPIIGPVEAPPPGPSAEYGAYLSSLTCDLCHASNLLGNPDFQAPPLIGIALAWSDQEFIQFMRTGMRPDGTEVDGQKMPWEDLVRFLREDDELRAIYAHMKGVASG